MAEMAAYGLLDFRPFKHKQILSLRFSIANVLWALISVLMLITDTIAMYFLLDSNCGNLFVCGLETLFSECFRWKKCELYFDCQIGFIFKVPFSVLRKKFLSKIAAFPCYFRHHGVKNRASFFRGLSTYLLKRSIQSVEK